MTDSTVPAAPSETPAEAPRDAPRGSVLGHRAEALIGIVGLGLVLFVVGQKVAERYRPIETADDLPEIEMTYNGSTYNPEALSRRQRRNIGPLGQIGDAVEHTYGVPVTGLHTAIVGPVKGHVVSVWNLLDGEYARVEPPYTTVRAAPGVRGVFLDPDGNRVPAASISGQAFIGAVASLEQRSALKDEDVPVVGTGLDGRRALAAAFDVFTASCDAAGRCTFVPGERLPRRWQFNTGGYPTPLPTFGALRAQTDSALAHHGLVRDGGSARWRFGSATGPLPIAVYLRDEPSGDAGTVDRTVVAMAYFEPAPDPSRGFPDLTARYGLVLARGTVSAAEAARRPAFSGQAAARPTDSPERPAETPRQAYERARDRVVEANRQR